MMETTEIQLQERGKRIKRVTLWGCFVNVILFAFKLVAGIIGASAAMIADAIHSLSDFLTDIIVLVFVKLSNKPQDETHDYGHGKFETLATAIIGLILIVAGIMIGYNAITKIVNYSRGVPIASPGIIALIAALVSILMKEWAYRFTVRCGKEERSHVVLANAWHHRTDAFSSAGTALGIGGAIFLGTKWAVLDPIAAGIVSLFIIRTAYYLIDQALGELLERSLPQQVEDEIVQIAENEQAVSQIHHLRTRRIGNHFAMEMHVRMDGNLTLTEAHAHTSNIENRLKKRFGDMTHVIIHAEPLKEESTEQS